MNGSIEGDIGLHKCHQPPSLHPHHQGYSQHHQEPAHYGHLNSSPTFSLNGGSSLGSITPSSGPTASLGHFVSTHSNNLGYNVKLTSDISHPDSNILSVQSSIPSSLPSLTSAASSLASVPSSTHPLHLSTGVNSIIENPVPTSSSATLLNQMNQLGPSERCTPSQAQSMGQQLLNIIAQHERNKVPLPAELHNSFDVFHRCLAVVYGTFFLNLYTKANAPCLICHGCKSLYPPGQFIHHTCSTLPPNILPCRSRMWRRCLVPLVSQGMDKLQQKQRWKYVLEKFSHTAAALAGRRNAIPPEIEAQILDMPELKRGRFVETPSKQKQPQASEEGGIEEAGSKLLAKSSGFVVKTEEGTIGRLIVGTVGSEDCSNRSKGYEGVPSMEDEPAKENINGSPEENKNLLDIEPPEYELDESSSPNGVQLATSQTSEGESRGDTPIVLLPGSGNITALGLAEQLVGEVTKLQQELTMCYAKLRTATEIIEKMPSEACMREQLAHALATQQSLTVERDQAREQFKLAQERGDRLQRQLEGLRVAYSNMEKLFSS